MPHPLAGSPRRALVSVSDKAGLLPFCQTLAQLGLELISTGGTAKALREGGLEVTDVSALTGFPEMLDGRVKTLHPRVHAGILADRSNPEHRRQLAEQGIEPIDLVVVSLYPFEAALAAGVGHDALVEQIDIGGPTLLRAAAKNHAHGPLVVCDVLRDGPRVLQALRAGEAGDLALRASLAQEVWRRIAAYDAAIASYDLASRRVTGAGAALAGAGQALRYGENPHQLGWLHALPGATGLAQAHVLQGEMSHNNWLDLDAAVGLTADLALRFPAQAAAVIVKHANACGVGLADTPALAYERAYLGDALSAAGGVLCLSQRVTANLAEEVMNSYRQWGKAAGAGFFKLDVWAAPGFDADAIELITMPHERRKWGAEVRLLALGDLATLAAQPGDHVLRSVRGGVLAQAADALSPEDDPANWTRVAGPAASVAQLADLGLAWVIAKHSKSNAITLVGNGQLLGAGVGQTSRVMSCRLAVMLAQEHGFDGRLRGCVAASDAFFPVPDGPQRLIDAGVSAIAHPGGSARDAETIALCEHHGVTLLTTGRRHFRH